MLCYTTVPKVEYKEHKTQVLLSALKYHQAKDILVMFKLFEMSLNDFAVNLSQNSS